MVFAQDAGKVCDREEAIDGNGYVLLVLGNIWIVIVNEEWGSLEDTG